MRQARSFITNFQKIKNITWTEILIMPYDAVATFRCSIPIFLFDAGRMSHTGRVSQKERSIWKVMISILNKHIMCVSVCLCTYVYRTVRDTLNSGIFENLL